MKFTPQFWDYQNTKFDKYKFQNVNLFCDSPTLVMLLTTYYAFPNILFFVTLWKNNTTLN